MGKGGSSGETSSSANSAVSGMSYSLANVSLTKRVAISPLTPTFQSGSARNFSIFPKLPDGLSFDVQTGTLSGTPKVTSPPTTYTINANNPGGFTSTTINLEVMGFDDASSTVVSDRTSTVVDAQSGSYITVTLQDRLSNPITGERVRITAKRGTSDPDPSVIITPDTCVTNRFGACTVMAKTRLAGPVELIARSVDDDNAKLSDTVSVTFNPGPATHFAYSRAPANIVAGTQGSLQITAYDAFENIATGHSQDVSLSTTDPAASIPNGGASFVGGVASVNGAVWITAGTQSVSGASGGIALHEKSLTVLPAAPDRLVYLVSPPVRTSTLQTFPSNPSVGIQDRFGNLVTGFTGRISLTPFTDGSCTTPASSAIDTPVNPVPFVNGVATFGSTRLKKTNAIRLGASADTFGKPLCSGPIEVVPAAPSAQTSSLSAPDPVIADPAIPLPVRITLLDQEGNPVAGVVPTITATGSSNSLDPCSASDAAGVSTCIVRSSKAEAKTISVISPVALPARTVVFRNGAPARLVLSGMERVRTAGSTETLAVEVLDAFSNRVLDFSGALTLSSNDPQAMLPSGISVIPAQGGLIKIEGISLRTAGERWISAAVTEKPSILGTLSGLNVVPGGVSPQMSTLSAEVASIASGGSLTVTLNARDAYGNPNPVGMPGKDELAIAVSQNGGSGTAGPVSDSGGGVFTFPFTGIRSGDVTLTGSLSGKPLKAPLSLLVTPGRVAGYSISGIPANWIAGSRVSLLVTARDAAGNAVPDYRQTAKATLPELKALLPGSLSFADGTANLVVTPYTAGESMIMVDDGTVKTASDRFTVSPGSYSPAQSSVVAGQDSVDANKTIGVRLITRDAYGNLYPRDPPAPESVRFYVASGPGSASFSEVSAEAGGAFTATLTGISAGNATIGATLANVPAGSQATVLIRADVASGFVLGAAPGSVIAGERFTVSLTAVDSRGNTASSYNGTVTLSSSENPGVPISRMQVTGGVAVIPVALTSTGTRTLTVTDGSLSATSSPVLVNAADAKTLRITATTREMTAGNPLNFSVTALDAFENIATGYGGTLRFTSSDPQAVLPSSPALTRGTGSFVAILKTAGTQTLTLTDGSLSATSPVVSVTAGAVSNVQSSITLTRTSATAGGESIPIRIVTRDAYGNANPTGIEAVSSISILLGMADGSGEVSALQSTGNGVYSADFKGIRSGSVSIGATINGSALTSNATVSVIPGAATRLSLGTVPAATSSGAAFPVVVSALDALGNVSQSYGGKISVASTDPLFRAPAPVTLSNGSAAIPVTLFTAGTFKLVFDDGTLSVSSSNITVSPGVATRLVLESVPDSTTAGISNPFRVTAKDASGNTAAGYSGLVSFTSNDPKAVLPAPSSLSNGAGSFTLVYKTAGTSTLTVTDGSLTTASTGTMVGPAAFSLSESTLETSSGSIVSGESLTLTLTLKDAFGNRVTSGVPAPAAVAFSTSTGTPGSIASTGTGIYTASYTGASSGSVVAQASADSKPFTQTARFTVNPANATTLTLSSIPASITAGTSFQVGVQARDPAGNIAGGYNGTLTISSTDPVASLPGSVTLANGTGSFQASLKTQGVRTLQLSDGSISVGSSGIQVNPSVYSLAQSTISVSSPTVTAGNTAVATLTLRDAYGNTRPSNPVDVSQIAFSGSVVSGAGTFGIPSAIDTGIYTSTFTGVRSGVVTLSALVAGAPVAGTGNLNVNPAEASELRLSGVPATATSGTAVTFTVSAKDRFDNTVTDFTRSLTVGSSDPLAPALQYVALAQGSKTVSFTFSTAGTQTLLVSDGSLSTRSAEISVQPGSVNSLSLTASSTEQVAGEPMQVQVTAKDGAGNTATRYSGQVTFSSSDSTAALPAAATLLNGTGTFSVSLKKAGLQTIQISDGSRSATSSPVKVTAGPYSLLQSTLSASRNNVISGSSSALTLTLRDAYGNSSPSDAPGPDRVGFSKASGDGSGDFGPVTQTGPSQYSTSFTGTAAGTAMIGASVSGAAVPGAVLINVSAGVPSQLVFTGGPGTVVSGTEFRLSLSARDSSGNTVPDYAGSIGFSSNDPNAVLPAASPLAGGSQSFSFTLKTSGSVTLTASDGTLSATRSFRVDASGATRLLITELPTGVSAGDSAAFRVTALDGNSNIATSYSGEVAVTTGDRFADLPAKSLLSIGTGTFSVRLKTAGDTVVTATDGTLSASSSVLVRPGAVSISKSILAAGSSTLVSGGKVRLTLALRDAFGNSPPANLPGAGSIAFNATGTAGAGTFGPVADEGGGLYSADFEGAATGSATVSALISGVKAGNSLTLSIGSGPLARLTLASSQPSTVAGTSAVLEVRGYDAFGNTAADGDTVSLMEEGSVLSTGRLSGGSVVFPVSFTRAGTHTLTAASGALSSNNVAQAVLSDAGSPVRTTWSAAPTSLRSGEKSSILILVKDFFDNEIRTGSLSPGDLVITASGGAAGTGVIGPVTELGSGIFAADFTASGAGTAHLNLTLRGIPAASAIEIQVESSAADHLVVSGMPSTSIAGNPVTLTIEAKDASGNTATSFEDALQFSSGDAAATLPQGQTLKAGTGTFTLIPKTAGTFSLTVASGALPVLTLQTSIEPGPVQLLALSGYPAHTDPGQGISIHLQVLDGFSNVARNSNDPVTIQSSTPGAAFPTLINLASGEADVPVVFNSEGSYVLQFTLSNLSASTDAIVVNAPAPSNGIDAKSLLVRITAPGEQFCTGIALDTGASPVILTSAHCVWKAAPETVRISNPSWGEVTAESVLVHEGFIPDTRAFDIALVKPSSKLDGKIPVLRWNPEVNPFMKGEMALGYAMNPEFMESKTQSLDRGSLAEVKGVDPATQLAAWNDRPDVMSGGVIFRINTENGGDSIPLGLISWQLKEKTLVLDLNSPPIRQWISANLQSDSAPAPSVVSFAPFALISSNDGSCLAAVISTPGGSTRVLGDRSCAKIAISDGALVYLNAIGPDGSMTDPANWTTTTPMNLLWGPGPGLFFVMQIDSAPASFDVQAMDSPVDENGNPVDWSASGTLWSLAVTGTPDLSGGLNHRSVSSDSFSPLLVASQSIDQTLISADTGGAPASPFSMLQSQIHLPADSAAIWGDAFDPKLMVGVYNPNPGCMASSSFLYLEPSSSDQVRKLMGLRLQGPGECTADSEDLYLNFKVYRNFLLAL